MTEREPRLCPRPERIPACMIADTLLSMPAVSHIQHQRFKISDQQQPVEEIHIVRVYVGVDVFSSSPCGTAEAAFGEILEQMKGTS